jgi:hypothetical protein
MGYILKNNLLALALIYIMPFLCFSIFGEKYDGEGDFLSVSFISFFFFTPGLGIQFILMIFCYCIFKGKNRYVSLALILLLSIDFLVAIFSLLLFGNMKTPHSSISHILQILITDTLYWTLSLIVCKIYMFVRLLMSYWREYYKPILDNG